MLGDVYVEYSSRAEADFCSLEAKFSVLSTSEKEISSLLDFRYFRQESMKYVFFFSSSTNNGLIKSYISWGIPFSSICVLISMACSSITENPFRYYEIQLQPQEVDPAPLLMVQQVFQHIYEHFSFVSFPIKIS